MTNYIVKSIRVFERDKNKEKHALLVNAKFGEHYIKEIAKFDNEESAQKCIIEQIQNDVNPNHKFLTYIENGYEYCHDGIIFRNQYVIEKVD